MESRSLAVVDCKRSRPVRKKSLSVASVRKKSLSVAYVRKKTRSARKKSLSVASLRKKFHSLASVRKRSLSVVFLRKKFRSVVFVRKRSRSLRKRKRRLVSPALSREKPHHQVGIPAARGHHVSPRVERFSLPRSTPCLWRSRSLGPRW